MSTILAAYITLYQISFFLITDNINKIVINYPSYPDDQP